MSATALATPVLIGRYAGAEMLGEFSLGYSIAVVCSCLVRALTVVPFSVFVHRVLPAQRSIMRGNLLLYALSAIVVLTASLVTLATLWFLAVLPSATWLGIIDADSARLSMPAMTVFLMIIGSTGLVAREVARQTCFSELLFRTAFAVDFGSSLMQLTGLLILFWTQAIRIELIFIVLGLSGWLSALGFWLWYRGRTSTHWAEAKSAWPETFRFGRWEAIGQSCQVAQNYSLTWIIALTEGVASAGIFAAVWSVLLLISPFSQAAGNYIGPILAHAYASSGFASLTAQTRKFSLAAAVTGVLYILAILAAGPLLLNILYGPEYQNTRSLMAILAVAITLGLIPMGWSKTIAILGYPNWNSAIQVLGFLTAITASLLLGLTYGVLGTATGMLMAQALIGFARWFAYQQALKKPTGFAPLAVEQSDSA